VPGAVTQPARGSHNQPDNASVSVRFFDGPVTLNFDPLNWQLAHRVLLPGCGTFTTVLVFPLFSSYEPDNDRKSKSNMVVNLWHVL